MKRLVAIVGPTASGKSELAVRLARKFNGEVVSADSRQVYKGLDIGSGKITPEEMRGVPHYLLNIVSPKRVFTAARYRKLALKAVEDIQKRGKLPFLVGGSPFYVYSATDNLVIPEVPPDKELRIQLERYSMEELYEKLQQLDPERAKTIEAKNPRRLVRALEIVIKTGKPVPRAAKPSLARAGALLFLGVRRPEEELRERIAKRLKKRLTQGMLEEVEQLHRRGLSWKRLEELGLEYRYAAHYLQGKISYKEMVVQLEREIWKFSRRQMTWFKRDSRIVWVGDFKPAFDAVAGFLDSLRGSQLV